MIIGKLLKVQEISIIVVLAYDQKIDIFESVKKPKIWLIAWHSNVYQTRYGQPFTWKEFLKFEDIVTVINASNSNNSEIADGPCYLDLKVSLWLSAT